MLILHLFIILLSEAAIYRTETRVDTQVLNENQALNSSRIVKLFIEDWPNKTNEEKEFFGNFRFECLAVPKSYIKLS